VLDVVQKKKQHYEKTVSLKIMVWYLFMGILLVKSWQRQKRQWLQFLWFLAFIFV